MKYEIWWETEGSAMRPFPNEDIEEFSKRITAIAWSNGEYVEREACAKICDNNTEFLNRLKNHSAADETNDCAKEIRARGNV